MTLISVEGTLKKVNKTLMKCCESSCFHVIPSSHNTASDFSSRGGFKSFKDRNAFSPLVNRCVAIADKLGIEIHYVDYDDVPQNIAHDFVDYLTPIEETLGELDERRATAELDLTGHTDVLNQVEQLTGLDLGFEELFACKYVRVRFGRLPADSFPKLRYYEHQNFFFFPFESTKEYISGIYLAPDNECVVVDDIFKSLFFERIRMPDYLHGTADEAKTAIIQMIRDDTATLEETDKQIAQLREKIEKDFLAVFSKLKVLNESYEIRKNVSIINNRFYLTGYVPKSDQKRFTESISAIEGVNVISRPHDAEGSLKPPVRLKNCRLFKPFEMFVEMYGLPSYDSVDPTPLVSITYMLMYGIMFGDLGQGLVIFALGLLLSFWKKPKIAPIMTRIGLSSAFFGILYGSVFGNEEIIQPFFHIETVYKAMGMSEPPENIFQISTFLLIAALILGVVLILISMIYNIIINVKNRKVESWLLGPNGVVGFVLYSSLLVGAGLQLGFGIEMLTTPYVICLIVVPIIILFLRGILAAWIERAAKKVHGGKLNKNTTLIHAVKTYSDAVSGGQAKQHGEYSFNDFAECEFIRADYGHMSVENYEKLEAITDKNFFFFPFDMTDEIVYGVFVAKKEEYPLIARVFDSLGFVTGKMPDDIRDVTKDSRKYLKKNPTENEETEKKSIGTYIIENFIDLFETSLSYITNTMSFLRVGGFILSHAGMMLVVGVLAESAGDGSIIVQILGNAFVIGMEGFLVAIQVLRLEFYELFSRFYEGNGTPFKPIEIDYSIENN